MKSEIDMKKKLLSKTKKSQSDCLPFINSFNFDHIFRIQPRHKDKKEYKPKEKDLSTPEARIKEFNATLRYWGLGGE